MISQVFAIKVQFSPLLTRISKTRTFLVLLLFDEAVILYNGDLRYLSNF